MSNRYLLLAIVVVVGLAAFWSCGTSQNSSGDLDTHKMLAGELQENHLYGAAIEEYQSVLAAPGLDKTKQANLNFLIGKIYFDNLKDYEKAAAYFVRARALDPNGSFMSEVTQNLVVCLERSGHMLDAKRELGSATAVDTTTHNPTDLAVAKIDGQPVWRSELEAQIQQLPPAIQKQLLSRDARIQYLRNYVGVELLYRAAQREHMDADPSIQRQKDLLFKKLVVQKYVEQRVMPQVSLDTVDARNFYLANKDTRYKGMPYDSARAQAFMDYESQKTESAYGDYIQKLASTSKVEFLDQNIR